MSVRLESGARFSAVLALVEAGLLVNLCSALTWANIGVRLDIVFLMQIPLHNEICCTFCISPRLLGGYGGNRLPSAGGRLRFRIARSAMEVGNVSIAPYVKPHLIVGALKLAGRL